MIRWTPRRKLQFLKDYDHTHPSCRPPLRMKHGVSPEEITEWRIRFEKGGLLQLQATRRVA